MFTGIITAIGMLERLTPVEGGLDMLVAAPYEALELGESIAVDGACLTVQTVEPGAFGVRVIRTSLDRTRFGEARPGSRVNLERALRAGDRLGGHIVQGHVDGVGTVERVGEREDAVLLDIRAPDEVASVSIPLGSIAVDGVSLTVNAVPEPGIIQISLIPFTLRHTTLQDRRVGDRVHLEGDTIGKYVRALMRGWEAAPRP